MKIAIITDTYLPQINGVSKTLGKLVDFLQSQKHKVLVMMPYINGMSESAEHVKYISSWDFPMYPEHKIALPRQIVFNTYLDNFKPDLLHIATPFTMGFLGLVYANLSKTPFVTSFHTNFDAYSHYFGVGFLENIIWSYFLWFHNQGQKTYCPSNATYKMLHEKGFKNLEIWTRGIEGTQFSPFYRDDNLRKSWSKNNEKIILYVGRISPEKDIITLIEAYEKLKNKDKVKLIITGDGPQKSELEEKVSKNIIFTGPKKGKELSTIYASADIFAFPSRTETFGNVVLEAMSSGIPVVGVNSGGVTDIIQHEYNGFLAEPGNGSDIARYLDLLITYDNLRQEMAVNAQRSSKNWSWQDIFQNLLNSYWEVLNSSVSKIS